MPNPQTAILNHLGWKKNKIFISTIDISGRIINSKEFTSTKSLAVNWIISIRNRILFSNLKLKMLIHKKLCKKLIFLLTDFLIKKTVFQQSF